MTASPLVAPSDDESVLSYPRFSAATSLLERNRAVLAAPHSVFGLPLKQLRRDAVVGAMAAARAYMQSAGDPLPESTVDSLIVSGHQPDLFHPGVWLKNFAIARLAQANGAAAINLLTDNDVLKHSAIVAPLVSTDPSLVRLTLIPFDVVHGESTLEDRTIGDEELFAGFPERVYEISKPWSASPIAGQFWADVQKRRSKDGVVGALFAGARRDSERRWGCHNWELPLSHLMITPAFAEMTLAILQNTPAVHEAYNMALRKYRKQRGIRNAFHPAPDLLRDGEWWEAPLWALPPASTRRERLFVRAGGQHLLLRAGRTTELGVNSIEKLEREGFRIRTRALMTTLMTRLLLADLFVHGIGGGKYDEATDEIIARLFGFEPPSYLVVTGTLRLPLMPFAANNADLREAHQELRALRWNPQRRLGGIWRARHGDLVDVVATSRSERRERYRQLRELNAAMQPLVASSLALAIERERKTFEEVHANEILSRRDYSFVLHSEEKLRRFLGTPPIE